VLSAGALLFDGTSALERNVTLGWGADGLRLSDTQGEELVPWGQLHHVGIQPGAILIGRHERPGWRLHVPHDSPAELLALLPRHEKYGGWIDRFGIGKAVVGFAAASAAVLAAVLTAPNWIGPMVPESWERSMGDAMVGNFDRFACYTPEADAALKRLARRLDTGGQPVEIYIANIRVPNAVALPGGKILVFDGFLAKARSADEVAGVLAHEIGHVRKRHVMQALLRQFGLSLLLSGADSGVTDTMAGFADLSYSRDAESEADTYSRERLAAANISPAGAAGFFARMRQYDPAGENDSFGYLASHPSSGAREKAFSAAVRKGHAYRPALTDGEFDQLRQACSRDPDVEDYRFF
jgi:Zn-dependent protease with chaperone function